MNLKLAGVAFGALMIGAMSAGAAKADVTAFADLNITNAVLTGDTVDIDPGHISNSVGAITQFGANGTTPAIAGGTTSGLIGGGTAAANQGTGGAGPNGASSSSVLTANPGGLLGGAVSSDTKSQITLLNGYQALQAGTGASSGTDSNFTFTAGGTGSVTLTISGNYTVYAAQSNSSSLNQDAHAAVGFSVDISDITDPTQADQTFNPIASTKSVTGAVAQNGSLTPITFAGLSKTFNFIAGHTYEFTINQTATTYGTAVPEPGTLALFGAGLAGLGFFGVRRQKKGGIAA